MPTSSLLAALLALSLATSVWCPPVVGQWAVAADVGSDRYWGASVESSPQRRSFRPYRPTTFGLGFERRAAVLGVGLRLRYAAAGLALEGTDALVVAKGVFKVYSASPELIYRIMAGGPGNQLLLHAGPLFEVWKMSGEDSRARVGVQGALSLSVPLGGRFAGSLTGGAAVTPSPFTRDQLDANYGPRALWSRRVAAGLEYRL